METVKDKLRLLWADKRSWKIRLPLAALCAFACVFTFLIFGPCEIYAQNAQEMQFPFSDLLRAIFLAGVLAFVALLGILFLLRGRIFNLVISFLFAGTLAGYLQGNFWNIDHGTLAGDTTNWLKYKFPMLKNCAAWLCIFVVVFLLVYLSRRIWTKGLNLICVIMIGAQIVALAFLTVGKESDKLWEAGQGEQFVTRDGIFEVSGKKNVIVFLLDRCDRSYIDEILNLHPEWLEYLNGFISYHDFTGSYSRTNPSITYLLTGKVQTFTEPWPDYFREAWEESNLLPDIHDAGYDTRVYADCGCVFGDAQNVAGFVDNVRGAKQVVDYTGLLKKMLILSAYRYLPEAMKPYFQIYSGDLNKIVSVEEENSELEDILFSVDDPAFWKGYRDQGQLTVDNKSKGAFIFYHLMGAHPPYNMDENGNRVAESGRIAQMTGNLTLMFQYFDDLKRLGVYDDSTIIITTDHAFDFPNGWLSELDGPRMLPLLVKTAGADLEEPMQVSNKQVCQDNLRASIAAYMGLKGFDYGRTLESVGEDESLTRIFWMQAYDTATLTVRDDANVTYKITGDANDFSNWKMVARDSIEYKMG